MADILNIEDGVLIKCTDKSVTSVVIPSSVTAICDWAFRGCSSLSSVVIPSSVTAICGEAFKGCTSLSSVVIPESVTAIGERAFDGCTSLSSVEIPSSVTEIGWDAFRGCNINELSHPCLTIKGGLVVEESKLLYCASQSSSITIPEGVTEISGDMFGGAFSGCSSLASVVIPPSVTKIGWRAFKGCTALASVVIPSSVTEIGWEAFANCTSLSSVEFGGTVAQWESVKEKLNLLEDIPATVVKCADGEWQKPILLVEDGVAVKCFDKSAASVVIPEGVTTIGRRAFSGCKLLTSVVIPSSVTEIGKEAFCGCESLAKVTLGDDFKKVPSEWFDDLNRANPNYEIVCTEGSSTYKAIKRSSKLKLHLKSLNVTKEDLELQKAKNAKIAEVQKAGVDAILPMVLEGVADSSFEILSNTKSATVALVQVGKNTGVFKLGADSSKWLPKLQKVIEAMADSTKSGEDIFGVIKEQKMPLGEISATKAENMTLKAGADKTVRLFCKGEVKAYGRGLSWRGYTWHSIFSKNVRSAELFGVTEIGAEAFRGCTALASVVIPDSVTKIGKSAFYDCTSLASVEIPAGVTAIDEYAFYGCTSLSSVVIPAGVTEIDSRAFYGCTSLSSVVIPAGVTEIDYRAFEDCTSLASVVIPSSVTEIGAEAFKGCTALASVVIPSSVTEIGYDAFKDCKSLASVVIPDSVTEIGREAFSVCKALASVEFGGTMAQWESVKGKPNLLGYIPATGVKCADGVWQKPVVLVKDGVAVKCLDKSAASVEIPAGVTEIGKEAFSGCKSLASVVIPSSVTEIGVGAFSGCKSLASVEIPPSVTEIGVEAFKDCTALASVVIPEGVTEIGCWAFSGCKSLASVEFGGTMAQWEAVKKGENWHEDVPAKSVKCADGEARL